MSEEQQHVIDEREYSALLREIGDSRNDPQVKDRQRELLGVGYRNLNGDPMEEKVRLLARTDWTQIKYMLAESARTNRIIRMLEEIKASVDATPEPAAPQTFSARLFDFLKSAKTELATVACFAIFFPNGGAVLRIIAGLVRGEPAP